MQEPLQRMKAIYSKITLWRDRMKTTPFALTKLEIMVIAMRFGLTGGRKHSLEEIGKQCAALPVSASGRSRSRDYERCEIIKICALLG